MQRTSLHFHACRSNSRCADAFDTCLTFPRCLIHIGRQLTLHKPTRLMFFQCDKTKCPQQWHNGARSFCIMQVVWSFLFCHYSQVLVSTDLRLLNKCSQSICCLSLVTVRLCIQYDSLSNYMRQQVTTTWAKSHHPLPFLPFVPFFVELVD